MQSTSQPVSSLAKAGLTLGALGVVFGDIGTSPLYALRECLHALPAWDRSAGIYGALSLVTWALVLVVCIKYLLFVMKADNRGEGGIFALLALTSPERERSSRNHVFTLLILFGAALLYGDGIITPAISVLGAVEGLKSIEPAYEHYIPAISCVILGALFYFQYKGTMKIGRVFGPVMLIWFLTIGITGLWHIVDHPAILYALNPVHGLVLLHFRRSRSSHYGGRSPLRRHGAFRSPLYRVGLVWDRLPQSALELLRTRGVRPRPSCGD
jgi:KUP system potassium uptake protein